MFAKLLLKLLCFLLCLGSYAMLNRAIAAEVSRRLSLGWTPSYCKLARLAWSGGAPRQWHYEVCNGRS